MHTLQSIALALLLCVAATLCSCASGQGIPPAGGPADTTPPAIVATDPPDGTLNFSGESVTVEFSEYVEESKVPQSVVITPIPKSLPEFDFSGNEVEITFKEPLVPNRTYAITFGADITDLSNNRLGRASTLRFATGPELDSGAIRGEVSGVNKRRAFVFAYLIPRDSASFSDSLRPDLTQPDFIAPVSDDGSFSLEGLPPGNFRLLAVADEYGDQLYTPGVDAYGVLTSDVRIDSSYNPVSGVAVRLGPAPFDLTSPALYSAASINSTRSDVRFSEPIDSSSIRKENFSIEAGGVPVVVQDVWRSTSSRLTVQVAHSPLSPGAQATVRTHNLRDSVGNVMPDSASSTTFSVSESADTLPPLLIPLSVDSAHAYSFPDSIRIAFDEAVRIDNPNGAVVLRDTAGRRAGFRLRRISPAEFLAQPSDTLFGVSRATIEIALGRFVDYSGNRRDSTARIAVAVAATRQNGTMQGSITDSAAPTAQHVLIAQNAATGKIYSIKGLRSGPWEFKSIPEGEYLISAFRDTNADGEYSYGSLAPYRPAEAYTAWSGSVKVRPRWTVNKVDLVFGR